VQQNDAGDTVAHGIKLAKKMGKDKILVLNICGRGDKDMETVSKALGLKF